MTEFSFLHISSGFRFEGLWVLGAHSEIQTFVPEALTFVPEALTFPENAHYNPRSLMVENPEALNKPQP